MAQAKLKRVATLHPLMAPESGAPRKRPRFNIPGGGGTSAASQPLTVDLSDEDRPKSAAPPRTPAQQTLTQASAAPAAAPAATPPRASKGGSPAERPLPFLASGLPARPGGTPSPVAPKAKAGASPPTGLPKGNDGKPGLPLDGVVMAFTGEMDSLTRQDAEEKAKAAGAKVMGSVSGNTQYLVLGSHLDDGRDVKETSKYRKYLELKEKGKKCPQIVDEEQFLKMLPAAAARPPPPPAPVAPRPAPAAAAAPGGTSVAAYANWVDLHAPKSFGEVLGNAAGVRKLTEWLRDWDNVVLRGQKKAVAFKPGGGMPENVNARAALVSGPPGIGKTTACRLVAQMHGGYEVLEYNASDARGQAIIQEMAEGIADNMTISFSGGLGQKRNPALTKRAIIIMDEVDGMGAGDRGGNAALIKMIKKTRNPIICICNDAGSPKVRSLAFNCYDLKFTRPTKNTVAQRCAQIARQEGLEVEPNALEALAESCGSDMRMVLNQLQMLALSPKYKQTGVSYGDMKEKLHEISKDSGIMMTTFDACRKLLTASEGARMKFRDRLDLFFVDHGIMGLLVQENYLNSVSKKPVDAELMNRCAYSADLMTLGDIMSARIRGSQEWSLLPDVGLTSCVYPATVTNGFVSFPSFPQWLGKYSTQSRMSRLCRELHAHLRLSTSVGRESLPTSGYPTLLYNRAMAPLMRGTTEAVEETAAALDAYGLRKEHLTEHLTELRTHLGQDDLFKIVDPKVKAAMTREFNSGNHAMKVVLPSKGKRKAAAVEAPEGFEEDDAAPEDPEAGKEAEDDGDADGLIKVKGKPKAKAKGKAKGKARGKAKGRA
uniref:Replication factor C subunit 1 n=1 Tax=Alexandrium monilatum TaxID=311494 RepID=A0A7S4SUN7_9DINO